MTRQLKKVTVYFTSAEYEPLQALAEEEAVSVSAVVRAKLGLSYQRRGAPKGNRNRQSKSQASVAGTDSVSSPDR